MAKQMVRILETEFSIRLPEQLAGKKLGCGGERVFEIEKTFGRV